MHSFLDKSNSEILLLKDNRILLLSTSYEIIAEYTHTSLFYYLKDSVAIDINKNVFTVTTSNFLIALDHLCTLKRNISALARVGAALLFCDRFGDIYGTDLEVLMGNLCFTTDMLVDEHIWTGDKYGRIRVSRRNGAIERFVFLKDCGPVLFLRKVGESIIAATGARKLVVMDRLGEICSEIAVGGDIKKLVERDASSFYCLTAMNTVLVTVDNGIVQQVMAGGAVDGVCVGSTLHLLASDGTLRNLGNDLCYKAGFEYSDRFEMLNYDNKT